MTEHLCPKCGKVCGLQANFCENCGCDLRKASQQRVNNHPAEHDHHNRPNAGMGRGTCREEILTCVESLLTLQGKNDFTVQEVVDSMRLQGTRYAESTIRTHITSVMCANAPKNHAIVFNDFVRVGHGVYRLAT